MKNINKIFASFVSSTIGDYQGDLFRSYIWSKSGLDNKIKLMRYEDYGNDLNLILLQFYVNPIPYEESDLKEIENYNKKEHSIGIPIVVNIDNFFSKSESERHDYIKMSILNKMELLELVVKRNKLDTKMDLLKCDLRMFLGVV